MMLCVKRNKNVDHKEYVCFMRKTICLWFFSNVILNSV